MSNIINFDNFKKRKLLNSQVLDFFNTQPFPSQYFYDENTNDTLVVLKKEKYLFLFFEFIPEGVFTDAPDIYDRSEDIMKTPRISTGEWVVFDSFLSRAKQMNENFADSQNTTTGAIFNTIKAVSL